jgi:hypothetical protein
VDGSSARAVVRDPEPEPVDPTGPEAAGDDPDGADVDGGLAAVVEVNSPGCGFIVAPVSPAAMPGSNSGPR